MNDDNNITTDELARAERIFNLIGAKSSKVDGAKIRSCALHDGDREKIIDVFAKSIHENQPIPVFKYWAKGYADTIDPPEIEGVQPEREGVEFLASVMRLIANEHKPGVTLRVLFDDTHERLNYNDAPEGYRQQMEQMFREYFEDADAGLHFEGVGRLSDHIPSELDYTATADGMEKLWNLAARARQTGMIDDEMLERLAPRAQTYFKGELGGKTSDNQAAQIGAMYHQLCVSERKPVGDAMQGRIFLTYNSSKQHEFSVPEGVPAFNMYALPGRLTDKPWNLTAAELVHKQTANGYDRAAENERAKREQLAKEQTVTKDQPSYAVVGGGLAGLSTAYHLLEANPDLDLTVFEKESRDSYSIEKGSSDRASSAHSGARTMRYMGAKKGVGIWNVAETMNMLKELQGYAEKPLFHGQASVYLPKESKDADATYIKYKQSLIDAGLQAGVGFSEMTGKELKERFPGYYETVPDDKEVLVEEPHDSVKNPNGAAGYMDSEATMKALIEYLKSHGATIHFDTHVDNCVANGEVIANGQTYQFDHAVVAPGNAIEDLVDCSANGIKPGYDRVLVTHIDMDAIGISTNGFPFTKGWAPTAAAAGAAYNADPDPSKGVIKFLPGQLTQDRVDSRALRQEIASGVTDSDKEAALQAASERFGVPVDILRPHTSFHLCSYTRTAAGEQMLAGNLSDGKTTVIGLDSSGSARVIGGLSKITAHAAIGKDEPYTGANEAFDLRAHQAKVGTQGVAAGPVSPQPLGVGIDQTKEIKQ